MTGLLNAMALNGVVAVVLAMAVWALAMVPVVRRRPGLRHCLWVVVLLKLVTPPLFEWSILPDWRAAQALPTTHPLAIPLDELAAAADSQMPNSWLVAMSLSPAWQFDRISPLLVIALGGTVVVLVAATAQIWKLRRALRHGVPNDVRLGQIAADCASRLGMNSAPGVCVVSSRVSPLLWVRTFGPLIVVPRRLADELTDEQLGCIVAHEVAHYLRRDHWTNLLSLLVAAVCWWNPVVWWARRELRAAQEACCDALVISKLVAPRRTYAETLFRTLEFLQTERSLLPALTSGFGDKSSTKRRFEMIASPLVNHRLPWWSWPLLLVALAMLPCLPSFAEGQESVPGTELVVSGVEESVTGVEIGLDVQEFVPANDTDIFVTGIGESDTHLDLGIDLVKQAGADLGVEIGYFVRAGRVLRTIRRVSDADLDIAVVKCLNSNGGTYVDSDNDDIIVFTVRQSGRHDYRVLRSERGLVVLAFDGKSKKLAWTSEIELPQPEKAIAGQRFLLHTGGGVVTIAVVEGDTSLSIQELDAQTGNVFGECRLIDRPQQNAGELNRELQELQRKLKRIESESKAAAEQTQKLLNERGKESGVSTRDGKLSLEYEDLGGGHFRDVTIDAGAEIDRGVLHKRVRLPGPSEP